MFSTSVCACQDAGVPGEGGGEEPEGDFNTEDSERRHPAQTDKLRGRKQLSWEGQQEEPTNT